jgi:hypothetical protein
MLEKAICSLKSIRTIVNHGGVNYYKKQKKINKINGVNFYINHGGNLDYE